jgi:hypothetical protein
MSPSREAPALLLSAADRAQILRRLLAAADGCRILLTPAERLVIADALALYEQAAS